MIEIRLIDQVNPDGNMKVKVDIEFERQVGLALKEVLSVPKNLIMKY